MTYSKETNADSLIKGPIFLVINSQLFLLYNFSKFLYIFTLFIHPSKLNITNKTPHCPDDGSAEPKRYSVDWLCFSITPPFYLDYLLSIFLHKLSDYYPLFSSIYIYIYIYIYSFQVLLFTTNSSIKHHSFVYTQLNVEQFYLTHWCYHSKPLRTWGRWQWRGTLHFPKLQHYWSLAIRLFIFISRMLTGWGSYSSAEMQSVYSTFQTDWALSDSVKCL